ncbi:GNAT family N-acetyltransferase [Neobacillus drentensis]|uniref:GNAT family N-acetyltransferase n=1 Tax=Neobacillus drentensis TaxID=220684 RepID=UPI002FFFE616
MKINNIEVSEGSLDELMDVYQSLVSEFPANELKAYKHMQSLLAKRHYKLLLAKEKEELVGYALLYEIEHLSAIWLDYMAIDTKFRNAGYGTQLFNKIIQTKRDDLVGMFVEVEIPEGNEATRKQQQRRINFYERLGARKLNIPYQLPTHEGGFPMYLYFKPSSTIQRLPKEQIRAVIAEVFDHIHSDIHDRYAILEKFLHLIKDENF